MRSGAAYRRGYRAGCPMIHFTRIRDMRVLYADACIPGLDEVLDASEIRRVALDGDQEEIWCMIEQLVGLKLEWDVEERILTQQHRYWLRLTYGNRGVPGLGTVLGWGEANALFEGDQDEFWCLVEQALGERAEAGLQ